MMKMQFDKLNESERNFHHLQTQFHFYVFVLVSTFILSACATHTPKTKEELDAQVAATQSENITHQVPNSLEQATNAPPINLGMYSPFGTASGMTPNNGATQTTPNTPGLATPFVVLQGAVPNTNAVNGVPANIQQLIKAKKWDEALKAIDVEAKKNPRNVQILFIKTRILIEQGQLESARKALNAFIEKYPEIPEPYNNLAALYARAGKLSLARDNLEMCIKLAPSNATCLQNLADIYTLTAASYYERAYQLNRKLTDADRKRKLAQAITQ
jgi:tetratricopeptide (TPR) repeat protein